MSELRGRLSRTCDHVGVNFRNNNDNAMVSIPYEFNQRAIRAGRDRGLLWI